MRTRAYIRAYTRTRDRVVSRPFVREDEIYCRYVKTLLTKKFFLNIQFKCSIAYDQIGAPCDVTQRRAVSNKSKKKKS